MKRTFLWLSLALLAVGALFSVPTVSDKILDRTIQSSILLLASRFQDSLLEDGVLHVWFCGTGSPQAEQGRAQSCTAVIADNAFLVFDSGPGSALRADLDNLPLASLTAVFFTHLHSDHIADLPTFANHSWRYGRTAQLDVYGPNGTEKVVAGFDQAMTPDVEIRSKNEVKHGGTALPVGHDVTVVGNERVLVYQDRNGLKVFAFLVQHQPAEPAFGYRVEYRGRVVVLSGDTRKTENVALHGRDADILIHEAYNKDLMNRTLSFEKDVAETPGSRRVFAMARLTQGYHTSPLEAAELAAKANARSLVFTHIIPPLGSGLKRRVLEHYFLNGVGSIFKGQVQIAEDSMHLRLPLSEASLTTSADGKR